MTKEKAKDLALLVLIVVVAVLVGDNVWLHGRIDRVHKDMNKQINAVAEVAETVRADAERVRADAERGWWQKCKDGWQEKWDSWRKN